MRHNPLTAPILKLLQEAPQGLSEFEIIRGLKGRGLYIDDLDDPAMTLFNGHFLVMNALYALQRDLLTDKIFLAVSPLQNRLHPMVARGSGQLQADATDAALSQYYLDWSNLDGMTPQGVDALLDGFWLRFAGAEQAEDALQVLELKAGADWAEIQMAYRRLAARHHPDRGGAAVRFVRVREAYEALKTLHRQ